MAKGLYKRGSVWWMRFAGSDGKIIFESTGTSKFKEAEILLLQKKQAVREGKLSEVKRVTKCTFHELADKYSQWMEGRHRSANSKSYRIKDFLTHFGNLPLVNFNTLVVEQYQTELMNRGLKPASVNKNISLLKAMIKKAVDWDLAGEDTLKRVRAVKLLQENNKRLRYLSKEEYQSMLANCDSHQKPIVITALNTGMRRGEILSLKWENVDLRNGFILLKKTKNGERREIPINLTLRETLEELYHGTTGRPRRLDVPYVFYDPLTGNPYQEVKKSFTSARRRANIDDFHFHDLRHFASHLVMAGADLPTVKELLGHKSLAMTVRYAPLAPAHKVKSVGLLDSTINEKSTIQKLYNLEIKG